jgi:Flp pilus assembly pilin Flp
VGKAGGDAENQPEKQITAACMDIRWREGRGDVFNSLRARLAGEEGQTLIEYALIISLISVVAIGALALTGTSITGILNNISSAV